MDLENSGTFNLAASYGKHSRHDHQHTFGDGELDMKALRTPQVRDHLAESGDLRMSSQSMDPFNLVNSGRLKREPVNVVDHFANDEDLVQSLKKEIQAKKDQAILGMFRDRSPAKDTDLREDAVIEKLAAAKQTIETDSAPKQPSPERNQSRTHESISV